MLTVNMQKPRHPYNRRNHPQIARGVNPDAYRMRRLSLQELMMENGAIGDGPKHLRDPYNFHNYPQDFIEYASPVATYNHQGRFTVSQKAEASRKRAMHRLQMDAEITGLVNQTRPKL